MCEETLEKTPKSKEKSASLMLRHIKKLKKLEDPSDLAADAAVSVSALMMLGFGISSVANDWYGLWGSLGVSILGWFGLIFVAVVFVGISQSVLPKRISAFAGWWASLAFIWWWLGSDYQPVEPIWAMLGGGALFFPPYLFSLEQKSKRTLAKMRYSPALLSAIRELPESLDDESWEILSLALGHVEQIRGGLFGRKAPVEVVDRTQLWARVEQTFCGLLQRAPLVASLAAESPERAQRGRSIQREGVEILARTKLALLEYGATESSLSRAELLEEVERLELTTEASKELEIELHGG